MNKCLTQSRLLGVDVHPVFLTKYLICGGVFFLGLSKSNGKIQVLNTVEQLNLFCCGISRPCCLPFLEPLRFPQILKLFTLLITLTVSVCPCFCFYAPYLHECAILHPDFQFPFQLYSTSLHRKKVPSLTFSLSCLSLSLSSFFFFFSLGVGIGVGIGVLVW